MSGLLTVAPERLLAFENQFDPSRPSGSRIRVLGHGRVSTVFQVEGLDDVALKRLPPFPTVTARALYERALNAYHMLLRDTVGLRVVDQRCLALTNAAGEHVLYIAQARQPADEIGDRVLARCTDDEAVALFATVLRNTFRVWYRNQIELELDVPGSEMGLDARLSNWAARLEDGRVSDVRYLDTGTPFYRRLGKDQLEPELFLSSVPAPLAGLVRPHFVGDVLTRYYDLRLVLIDFLADLQAGEQAGRLPVALHVVNHLLTTEAADLYVAPVKASEVAHYARQDARFWRRFLALSRFKRFTTTRVFRQKYHFLLPG
jgi:hypothetical protein